MDNPQQESQAARRARISYACEACRAAKVKCQPGSQVGICKRCSDSKRECIFKTGPRTRRRRLKHPSSAPSNPPPTAPPPPGPSKTFTIDIPIPDDEDDPVSNLEALRLSHEMYIADLGPTHDDSSASYSAYSSDEPDAEAATPHHASSTAGASSASHASSLPVGASALSTPPSSVALGGASAAVPGGSGWKGKKARGGGGGRALAGLGVRPEFNLDSAELLLAEFESRMLPHFPAVAPPPSPDDGGGVARFSVAGLARTKPFVLLAVLAAASGSRTLQGHSLYDEEFRKILGLKFVAGGERSLELLQGLVVYTAWYPFHLRPKNKQAFQYVRMAVDIVNDLELDQDPDGDDLPPEKASEERLEQIRAYLATYYLVSSFAATWNRTPALYYTKYTARCCDILERDSATQGDHILAWLVRLQHILEEVNDLRKTHRAGSQNEYQVSLMLKGMESQLAEWETRMPPELSSTASIRLSLLFAKLFIPAAPLLKLPAPRPPKRPAPSSASPPSSTPIDPARLSTLLPTLHHLFAYLLSQPPAALNALAAPDWALVILAVILAFRLSFPLPECPGWDDGRARRELGFGGVLARFEALGGRKGAAGADVDVLAASQVVLAVVRAKWERRAARMDRRAAREMAVDDDAEVALGAGAAAAADEMDAGAAAAGGLDPALLDAGAAAAAGLDPALLDAAVRGCPMMDGSLDAYFPLWDESFSSAALGGAALPTDEYAEIWGTVTAEWAQWPLPDGGGFEGFNVP